MLEFNFDPIALDSFMLFDIDDLVLAASPLDSTPGRRYTVKIIHCYFNRVTRDISHYEVAFLDDKKGLKSWLVRRVDLLHLNL